MNLQLVGKDVDLQNINNATIVDAKSILITDQVFIGDEQVSWDGKYLI